MMKRLMFCLVWILFFGITASADILGIEEFNYSDGAITGQAGGQYWDWNNTAGLHTGTVSNWNTVFGFPVVQNKALFIDSSGARREYNGPTEGSGDSTDERLGAFRGSGTVYYGVTMTELTENPWCGFSSYDFGSERIFFGRPGGSQFFGIEISGSGRALSTIPVIVGQTYRLVSALDFDGDQIRLWVNPDSSDYDHGAADNSADVTLAYTGSNWSTSIRLAGGAQSLWDDLVISNSFTDIAGPAITHASPANGAVEVAVDTELTWQLSGSLSEVTYAIYFGEQQSAVAAGDSSVFAASQSAQTFSPGLLKTWTAYYWRVDVVVDGQTYPGRVLQFTTALPSFDCVALDSDLNSDCTTDITDLLAFAEQWLGACAGPFCADMNQAGGIDFSDFARLAGEWQKDGPVVVVNEFLASNSRGLIDEDGAASDWIEIKNLSDAAVNLNGWSLTDDPAKPGKWKFPNVTIDAHGFRLVFASDKDRVDPAGSLHANFQLSKGGEYLALVRPDGSISHAFTPHFPPQYQDISYGLTVFDDSRRYEYGYFSSPTPQQGNGRGFVGVVEDEVKFSIGGGVFTESQVLTLSVNNPTAAIYYTTNNSEPTEQSIRYTGPISITTTTVVRARAVEPGKVNGPVTSQYYVFLAPSVQGFHSNLPLLVIDNFGGGALGDDNPSTAHAFKPSVVGLFTVQSDGRSRLTHAPQILSRAGAKVRGISSSSYPKKGYAVEFWDERDEDKSLAVLDMPADSDWVLYAPYYFDRAMIRNSLIYELSNQVGRYAPRTRFVEVFLNTNGGALEAGDYIGVYALTEKIKRGKDRVAVEKLDASDNTLPDVAGGYIFKNDWLESGEMGWYTTRGRPSSQGGMGSALSLVYPEQENITDAQLTYLKDAFQAFEDALYSPAGRHYSDFIDVDSWVDHNLLNMFAKNVDALRLSAYFHKSREGKIQAGPIWDFDRAMDSYDGRDDSYNTWKGTGDGTDYFHYEWWDKLFDDPAFRQRYAQRWYAMRAGALSTSNINAVIDAMAAQLGEAQVRNFARWPEAAPASSWANEIQHLKDWLAQRAAWIDTRMAIEFAPPSPAAE
jgi:hypothetical protein